LPFYCIKIVLYLLRLKISVNEAIIKTDSIRPVEWNQFFPDIELIMKN